MIVEKIILDYVSIADLEKLDVAKRYSFEVYSKASIDVLEFLNTFLIKNEQAFIYFNCEIEEDKQPGYIYNLDILKHLTNAKYLFLFPKNDRTDLTTLENFKYLKELEEFILLGIYKKSLDLTPILKFKDSITRIELENGVNKKQQAIITQCTNLEILKIKELALETFDIKEKLHTLYIQSNLHQMSLVPTKFPNLERLRIQGCKSSLDIPALNTMTSLKVLNLFWIYGIEDFPDLTNLINLRELRCTLPNLQNLDNLWTLSQLNHLESISICELKHLEPKNFIKIDNFKHLRKAYITWKGLDKHDEITDLIENKGLEYRL